MRLPPIKLTTTSLGNLFLTASARYEQHHRIAETAWEMLFDNDALLPDHQLPELVNHLVDRAAFSVRSEAA
jgi:hypothetical protein